MTREEIEEWMREAAGVALKAALMCKAVGNAELSEHYGRVVEAFKTRASQVEAMRCGTCDWWIGYDEDDGNSPVWECKRMQSRAEFDAGECEIGWCGPDFGCFHHKLKVTG